MISFKRLRLRPGFAAALFVAVLAFGIPSLIAAAREPAGKVTIAWHVTISPAWFDPSTAPPQITPFGMLYALHDGLVRAYPGHKMGRPSRNRGRRAKTA